MAVCKQYTEDNLVHVCPPGLRHHLYTVGALDNIDHNPSSTTAESSFHGTGISLFQFPTQENVGLQRSAISIQDSFGVQHTLPDIYTNVPAVVCDTKSLTVPERSFDNMYESTGATLQEAKDKENDWITTAIALLCKDNLEVGENVTWAAYHASNMSDPINPPVINALLPLFYNKAASLAMIKHGMNVIMAATSHLNPGQVAVMAVDQPLFALAKFIQWKFPETHGEDNMIVMFGGLHIEIALWHLVGDLLDGSGWTTALCESGVASSGTAESFLRASHLTKTRHSHQVTLLTLEKLLDRAWQLRQNDTEDETFQEWKKEMMKSSPTFRFWMMVLELEKLVLVFVRAQRTSNLNLYTACLEALTPWFFALDKINYARWIPTHTTDMKLLSGETKEALQKDGLRPKR